MHTHADGSSHADHGTDHTGDHAPPTESLPEPSGPGSVVLDIGGDIGAAVVYTRPELAGVEIEIRRHGDPWDGRHVAVLERRLPGETRYAAVFGQLSSGRWEVRVRDDTASPVLAVEVEGGRIAYSEYR